MGTLNAPEAGDFSDAPNDKNDKEIEEILSKPAYRSTPARLRVFLEAYAKTGRVNRACEAAGIAHKTHYRRLECDPVYRRAFEQAAEQVGQMLEDAAVDRALNGDSHLLLALLKRFRPDAYRERVSADISISLVDRMTAAVERVRMLRRHDDSIERAG